ncbi:MAG: CARDB domain-containing protein [Bacillota bacterium]
MNQHSRSLYFFALFAVMMLVAAGLSCSAPSDSPDVPPDTSPFADGGNLVITAVSLSTATPAVEEWVTVEVTVENQGTAAVAGYELVLISHYGDGPPNPSGVEPLPDMAPGATHTVTFEPGLLYMHAGPATLRVLATDTWYELGDAESTGEAGDYRDVPIAVKDGD